MRADIEQIELASKRLAERELSPAKAAFAPVTEDEHERTIGSDDLVDQFYLERALVAAKPVCRIAVRDEALHTTSYATGFMVSPSLLLTNWHVFKTRETAAFSQAHFDYTFAITGDEVDGVVFDLDPGAFYDSNKALDYALVAVKPRSRDSKRTLAEFGYHRLNPTPWKVTPPDWVTIVQHPGGARRQFAIRENQLLKPFDGDFLWYRSDTAQGSSGAPAFNDSFQVVALHHAGRAKRDGAKFVLHDDRRVDSLEGIDDSDVLWEANEGIRVSALCKHFQQHLSKKDHLVAELFNAIEGETDIMSTVMRRGSVEIIDVGAPTKPLTRSSPVQVHHAAQGTSVQVPLTLHITVSVTTDQVLQTQVQTSSETASIEGEEKIVVPPVDPDYENRAGYQADFLDKNVPHPTPTNKATLATTENGDVIIPYEHFSLVMHKQRRLALYTISNVHGDADKRKPEAGKVYTRRALGGLVNKSDKEGWLTDPRIPARHQLPEKFYDQDGSAFDKGHLVRREDVCWGRSYDQVKKANADTFHTTNCSPQVASFNRSQFEGLWGELENEILRQVKGDRYTLIAGPVLDAHDKWFDGKDERGKMRIQIPSRYWKVIVTTASKKLQAFAFLLEQDLSDVKLQEDEDFEIPTRFATRLVALSALEELVELKFPQVLHDADQHDTDGGEEVLRTTSARRARPRERLIDDVRRENV